DDCTRPNLSGTTSSGREVHREGRKATVATRLEEFLAAVMSAAEPVATDSDLLRRFADHRDEEAFAVLVRRHASMVFATCCRVLGRAHDAEDASQATFVLLARKARARDWQASLAGWLHATARQVALNARRRQERQVRHESQTSVRS